MKNYEVVWILEEIADLLELAGENPFKARAYRRAARSLEALDRPIGELVAEGSLREVPGVGEAIAGKIAELVTTGRLAYLERLRAQVPPGLKEMLAIPGVGPRLARLFYEELKIDSIAALEEAARAQRLRELRGVGAKVELNILQGIQRLRERPARVPLGVVLPIGEEIRAALAGLPGVRRAELAGSARRRRDTVGDLDFLVAAEDAAPVMAFFTRLPVGDEVLAQGEKKASVLHRGGFQMDLRVVRPEEFAPAWLYFTGSKEHNIRLRGLAQEKGYKLNEYGLFALPEEKPVPAESEADLYRALGLPFIEPELREDRGEIEAARAGALPVLIERRELRGDLHVHSRWSDGTAALKDLKAAAAARGYEYLAICDHSKSLGIARGLDVQRLRAQWEEIDALNARGGVRLLKGVEVDILADGRLDLPDEVLAELDVVVASVHTGLKQEAEQLWRRVEGALRNPHVDILAHPSGRLLGQREASALDLERVIALAAETGTALEINSFPDRLDLTDLMARRAAEAGVALVINTDAHAVDQLDYIEYGVATARRGWIGARHVLNTLPLTELLARLERKAQRR
ncbi:MAG: DNA polymerase/3'-5' exonuclease PolX [Bacillota bacterium]|nr:DNA polymerase/3'-5' exonuclease PolX [Bacillota bacterium]